MGNRVVDGESNTDGEQVGLPIEIWEPYNTVKEFVDNSNKQVVSK